MKDALLWSGVGLAVAWKARRGWRKNRRLIRQVGVEAREVFSGRALAEAQLAERTARERFKSARREAQAARLVYEAEHVLAGEWFKKG